MTNEARTTASAYFRHWTEHRFDEAVALLDPSLVVEVPMNDYPTRASFAAALEGFGGLAEHVALLSELGEDDEAMQLYDMRVAGLGVLRIVEHFTVREGKIVRLRQIHDTAQVRAAGFAP